ncbi:MAG TPA: hypothetical protein PKM27_17045 [Saprospiraceae bacterium]|nr:hypothetical protein [Saprospiraceae bacterium]HNT22048.1 hypothetical protein [Saprospiraceae bacterium]
MKKINAVTLLTFSIAVMAASATVSSIFFSEGPGPYEFLSIRGQTVMIYGKGIYRHMSAEVAPQGIAQDYVTLFIALPLLLVSLFKSWRGSLAYRVLHTGCLAYFLVTYLFYLMMAMYNGLFLVYAALLGSSFFAFIISLNAMDRPLTNRFESYPYRKFTGGFLMFNALAIALLWMGIVVPPLMDGTLIPMETRHYTTLVVQGLDLAILLPSAFVLGWLFWKKQKTGDLLTPVYYVFLSILLTALMAKIIAMGLLGYSIFPVVFIIPVFLTLTLVNTGLILKQLVTKSRGS